MSLTDYHRKRNFKKTAEPEGKEEEGQGKTSKNIRKFVVQKHAASHLHYDFRLELDGVLKSWAVPKGPSMNPKDKRLAMQVEDHPIEYGDFEGVIPEGEYGGGTVMLWDQGEWEPLQEGDDPLKHWSDGSMKFRLKGQRLTGSWALVRMKGGKYGDNKKSWLLIKERDDEATDNGSVTEKFAESVTTARDMEGIAEGKKSEGKTAGEEGGLRVWTSKKAAARTATELDVKSVNGAKKASMPAKLKPQLATLVKSAPEGPKWVHEIKFDGYRFLAFIEKGKVSLITRNGKDWTEKFSGIATSLARLPVESAIVDGELVAIDSEGVTRFQLLQNSLQGVENPALGFYAFDLVYLNGYSLKSASLEDRKALLRQLMDVYSEKDDIHFSEHFSESGEIVWEKACKMGLEGIVSKDLTAGYVEKRSQAWVKVKCSNRQEFVIGGFTEPSGSRAGFGALLVGFYDANNELRYAGKVGTGFNDELLKKMHGQLQKLEQKKTPFVNSPSGSWTRRVHWVNPELIGEVAYTEMTDEGMLRHPSFQGLREDKKAKAVKMEVGKNLKENGSSKAGKAKSSSKAAPKQKNKKAKSPKAPAAETEAANVAEVKLTHPDKVLFPDEKYTKQDLWDYYSAVADRAYPWLANRPITLVRCPEGRSKPCFYQRHNKVGTMAGIEPVDIEIKGGNEKYIYLAEPAGLRTLVQQSTLEIHGWQCKADDVERPDRIIFDVDPSEEVDWAGVVKAAKTLKGLLEKCGFKTFVMTTGGKGLHVVVPLKPAAGWDAVVGFAQAIARYLETVDPENYTANLSKKKRVGKVFVDYLRNNKTASAVLPYSTRARPGATVATPLRWSEATASLDPRKFDMKTVPRRIASQKSDPWQGFEKARKELDYDAVIERLQGQKVKK